MRCDSGKPAYLRLRRVCLTAAPSSAPSHAHPSRYTHTHTTRWALTYPDPVQMNLDGGWPSPFLRWPPHLPAGAKRLRPARANPSRESCARRASHQYPTTMRLGARPRTAKDLISRSNARRRASQSSQPGSICATSAREGQIRRGEHIHVVAGARRSKPFCTQESS